MIAMVKSTMRSLRDTAANRFSPSGRVIKDLPDWAGFGNQLFFYLWASTQRRRGVDFWLVSSPRSEPWTEHFPELADLTIERSAVRWDDRRDATTWECLSGVDHAGTATANDLAHFIETYLMPSGWFRERPELARGLTLNVRRGDYFSDPRVRGIFSFDQIAYIDVVMDELNRLGREPEEIRVVSDDVAWCRARLGYLESHASSLTFAGSGDPAQDFAEVACSREMIIMNSSFSIWAAYISNHLYGDNHEFIHAPAFGTRPFMGEPWRSIDARWHVVESIPGGWDS